MTGESSTAATAVSSSRTCHGQEQAEAVRPELRWDGGGEHVTVNVQLREQRQLSELLWDAAGEGVVVVQGERPQVPDPRPDLS